MVYYDPNVILRIGKVVIRVFTFLR